jgi:uncharacterized protein (DUF2267 family)
MERHEEKAMRYDEFIGQVRQRARLASREEAERATRATLETLAYRLQGNEVKQLAAQLPGELELYMQPAFGGAGDTYDVDEFFRRVAMREGVNVADASFHARVVTGLLSEIVTMGEIEDVRAQLPPDFAKLFAVENEGEIPGLEEYNQGIVEKD